MSPTIGQRIKRLRLRQKRTLEQIASLAGFSKSLLSKIECGKTTPPIATLTRIASALGVNIGDIVSDQAVTSTAYTPAEKVSVLTRTEKGYEFGLFAATRAEKQMQPFLFVAKKGKVKKGTLSHPGEEFVYVLEGRMKFRVGNVEYQMGPGDGLYFDAQEEHDLQPISEEVRYLAVFTDLG